MSTDTNSNLLDEVQIASSSEKGEANPVLGLWIGMKLSLRTQNNIPRNPFFARVRVHSTTQMKKKNTRRRETKKAGASKEFFQRCSTACTLLFEVMQDSMGTGSWCTRRALHAIKAFRMDIGSTLHTHLTRNSKKKQQCSCMSCKPKLKFDVHHEVRQSCQLYNPDRFRCFW